MPGRKVSAKEKEEMLNLLSVGLTPADVARAANRDPATIWHIKEKNKEVIQERSREVKTALAQRFLEKVNQVIDHLTPEKMASCSGYQLAGMAALLGERYMQLDAAANASQQSPQNLTLIQVNERKDDVSLRLDSLRADINAMLKSHKTL